MTDGKCAQRSSEAYCAADKQVVDAAPTPCGKGDGREEKSDDTGAALHRLLQQRLGEDYDPAQHLGGAVYLFLRGMSPADTGAEPAGVFWWRPPTAAILELDLLLTNGGAS